MELLQKRDNETKCDFLKRLATSKEELSYTWNDIRDIMNEEFNLDMSESHYRKLYSKLKFSDEANGLKDVYKQRDIDNQERAQLRRNVREETIREIAHDAAQTISSNLKLDMPKELVIPDGDEEAILMLSDWHYGIEVDSYFNTYNRDIAKERLQLLVEKVVSKIKQKGINRLHVVNLGDLICGRIHLQLRLSSRIDVVTQIMEVSELMAQFINILSHHCEIEYYDTLDNHSRLEPIKENSLELETLSRITTWYLKERLGGNEYVHFNNNKYADDIVTFEVMGHKVAAVHGDKDKPEKVIDNLSMMTHQHFDLVLSAHYHHFNCDEQNQTVRIGNGSLMGTDDYAQNLRLNSEPSQTMIVVSLTNPVSEIYKINL